MLGTRPILHTSLHSARHFARANSESTWNISSRYHSQRCLCPYSSSSIAATFVSPSVSILHSLSFSSAPWATNALQVEINEAWRIGNHLHDWLAYRHDPPKSNYGVSETPRWSLVWNVHDCVYCSIIDQRSCCDRSRTDSPLTMSIW
jgi:hypothetical protein